LFGGIFYLIKFELEQFMYVFVRRKVKNLRICQVLRPQKKIWVRKSQKYRVRKSQICKLPHLQKVRKNVTNFVSPQICGFAICGPPTSANWPSVSTTPVVPVGKFTAVVVDTSSKFSTGVADTSGKFSTGVVDTGGVP
jgi:hypothetical protein